MSNKMWTYWADAPNEQAQSILDRGMAKRAAWDLLGAREDFDALIAYCPKYAEGYNQRAFVHFLSQNFQAALLDLDQALALSPDHVAALSGRALSLLGLNRIDEARETLQSALEMNPWLPERGMLDAGGALAPKGQDI
ncbi:lipoprotein NlpI [Falsiruegeria litorea R37]|uniref:Lipoprotein NlpI n=1 Tax=Falsiruegeria litorea R37 TaxID=1200284 RepID=A0A1Y5T445_9RHOB|nr:lipoprotein NlpI [Falsiruegeria litorea R37]